MNHEFYNCFLSKASIFYRIHNVIQLSVYYKRAFYFQDIQDYLDASSKGVVYFSLGSNIKSANLPNQTKEAIISALAELPYNVLWKWETDHLPGQPKNVMVKKWLPQQDILGK